MFDTFWQPPPIDLPGDPGFGLFTPTHLVILAVLAVVIAAIVVMYCRLGEVGRHRTRLIMGCTAMASSWIRAGGFLWWGVLGPESLPLWMCSMGIGAMFLDCLKPNSWTREWTYAMTLWGAVCALTFSDWADRPWFNIFSFQSFYVHVALIAYALMLLVSRELVPNWKNLWKVAVVTAVVVPVAMLANHLFGTNFWFLNSGSPGSPLDPILAVAGSFYIPVLIVAVAIVWALLYLPWVLWARRARRRVSRPVPQDGRTHSSSDGS
ncbi:MAG: YwaF family protein [Propionibacteriaceae bacterium]|jgi:hypothetical integral membrane protein (TIGR02206 family)|nr:YwaF family protein [Propionibacteriaceae bacterium]